MKKLEKILLILMAMATMAKLVPVVGSSFVLTIAALPLSCLYFFFGFAIFTKIGFRKMFKAESYKHLKPLDIIISILTGWAFQVLISGLLFQLQYWPGTNVMSFTGLISSIPFIILAAFLLGTQNRYVYIGILKRGIPLVLFLLILHLLPLTAKLDIFKVADPEVEARILKDANENNRK